jgi:hypothetical protein
VGCYLNCTQMFILLLDASNDCAPKERRVRFGPEVDNKHVYIFSVQYCVRVYLTNTVTARNCKNARKI